MQADFAAGSGAGGDLPDPTASPDGRDAEWTGGIRPGPDTGAQPAARGAD